MEWVVLVPVKRLREAKSRLPLPAGRRAALMAAMATDAVAAASAAPGVARVVVVSAEPQAWRERGVEAVAEQGVGLSAVVAAAVAGRPGPLAVLAGDLPALRPAELSAALAAAATVARGVVADTPGTGTVLLTARAGERLAPSYGEGSLARHVALGAHDLTPGLAAPGLRRDVDVAADWAGALALGVGPATAALGDVLPLAG